MIKKVEKRIRGKKKKQLLKQAGNFDPTIKKSKSSIDDDESDPEEFVNPNSIKSTESDSKKDQKKSESESKKSSNSSKTSKSSKKWQSVQFSNLDILSEFQKHGGVSFEVMDGEGIEVIAPDKMIVESKKKSKSKKGDYKTVAAAAKPNDSNDDNDDGDDSDSDMSYNSEFERELEEMGIGKSDVKKEMKKMDAKPKKVEKSESNKSESRVTESTETKVTEKLNKDKKDKLKVNEKKVTAEDSTKSKSPEEQLAELREKKKKKPLSKAQKELFTKLQLEVGTKKSKKREGDSEDKDDKNSPDTETEAAAPPKKKQKKEKEAKTKSSTIETTSKSSDSPNTVDESNESLLIHPLILQNWSYNILSNNSGLQLHPLLLEGLSRLKFYKPSLVQERCLMAALAGKDIVCAAETGSGKTLAYGLPLVDRALRKFSLNSKENPNELQSLVILPTRELSEQVRQHIMDVYYVSNKNQTGKGATSSNKGSKSSDPFLASRLLVTSLVGGLSPEKQVRILEQKRPAIVLGTPGRLAMLSGLVSPGGNDKKKSNLNGLDADSSGKLANTHNTISDYLKYGLRDTLQCLCLDEADRLVERGHFRDLIKVLDYVYEGLGMRKGGREEEEDSFEDKDMEKEDETDAESDNLDKNDKSDSKSKTKKSKSESLPKTKSDTNAKPRTLQTLVFSATLATQDDSEGMQQMLQRVNLRNDKSSNLKTIDLTKEKTRIMSTLSNDDTDGNKNSESVSARGNLPSTLQLEELVFNKESDRESLLCHYLLKEVLTGSQCGPGSAKSESAAESDNKNIPPKTIIFVNAITSVYRLSSILSVLFSNGADSGKLASIGVSGKNKNGANLNIGSDVEVLTLHSSMTQRDRLKKMEKFRGVTNTKSTIDSTVSDIDSENKTPTTTKILICTDIAARGLDVSDVGHVVHYQVPRSHESFIHRTGRTARAGRRGRCLILQSPEDSLKWNEIKRKVFGTNGNNKNSSEFSIIPTLDSSPLGSRQFNQNLRPAIDLCVELEKKLHAKEKHDSEKRWYEKAGKELDLDIDHVVGYTSSDTEESEADGRRVYKDDEMDSGLNSKALGKKTEFSKGEKGNLMQMYNQLQQKIRNYVNGK